MHYELKSGQIVYYNVAGTNCCIFSSYEIKDKPSKYEFIEYLLGKYSAFNKRTAKSYYREWTAHNILYRWHICKSRTMNTDLNIDESSVGNRLFS